MPNDITCTKLTAGGSATSAGSYNTASITAGSGKLILLTIHTWANDTVISSIVNTALGLTWTLVRKRFESGGNWTSHMYSAVGNGNTGAITINFSSNPGHCCGWNIFEFANVDTATANGIVQEAADGSSGGASMSVTLAAFGSVDNATFASYASNRDNGDMSAGTGFTEVDETQIGTYNAYGTEGIGAEFRNDNDTSVTAGAAWGWNIIAVEIKRGSSQSIVPILNSYRQRRT